ncbi:unnamed protein product, partial [Ectocarpus fasciculatus]
CRRLRHPQGQSRRERRRQPQSAGWRVEQLRSTRAGRPRLGRSFPRTSTWWWPSAGSTWVCTWCARESRRSSRPQRRRKSLPPSSLHPRRVPTSPKVTRTTSGNGSRARGTWRSTSRQSTRLSRGRDKGGGARAYRLSSLSCGELSLGDGWSAVQDRALCYANIKCIAARGEEGRGGGGLPAGMQRMETACVRAAGGVRWQQ